MLRPIWLSFKPCGFVVRICGAIQVRRPSSAGAFGGLDVTAIGFADAPLSSDRGEGMVYLILDLIFEPVQAPQNIQRIANGSPAVRRDHSRHGPPNCKIRTLSNGTEVRQRLEPKQRCRRQKL
jgi:hypothetical protein